ncbi:MAG: TonB C-terminal domain-containing protein [Desulfosarcina sp.]|nr:TonB C-terminal domain-containing protein [Desulfobacterales bacterium]
MKKKSSPKIYLIIFCVAFILITVGGTIAMLKKLSNFEGHKVKRQIQMVKLLKPPPPPKIKEKFPEPEVKKEEMIEPEEIPPEEVPEQASDDAPAGDELGLDAEGGTGSDGFGLAAKKGGRSIIGGGGANSFLRKYAWYTKILEDEISRLLVKTGQSFPGDLKTYVRIELNEDGRIGKYKIYGSSGDSNMDRAVQKALSLITCLKEPPPDGMPRCIKIMISSPV